MRSARAFAQDSAKFVWAQNISTGPVLTNS